jgi:hypothetical protein
VNLLNLKLFIIRSCALFLLAIFFHAPLSFADDKKSEVAIEAKTSEAKPAEAASETTSLSDPEDWDKIEQELGSLSGEGVSSLTWIRTLSLLRRIDEFRTDAVTRRITGQREVKRIKLESAAKEVNQWIHEYNDYAETREKYRAAIRAYDKRAKTLQQLYQYLVAEELLGENLNKPGHWSNYLRPTEFTPVIDLEVKYSSEELQQLTPIPQRFYNKKFLAKQIAVEDKEKQNVEELLVSRDERQAILQMRLEKIQSILDKISLSRQSAPALPKKVELPSGNKNEEIKKDRPSIQKEIKNDLAAIFADSRTAKKLRAPKSSIEKVNRARQIDRFAERYTVKKTYRGCASLLGNITRVWKPTWKTIGGLASTPTKIAFVIGTTTLAGKIVFNEYTKVRKTLHPEMVKAEEEKKAADQRKIDIENDLQKIVDNAKSADQYNDDFYTFAQKYYEDGGVKLFYQFMLGMRPNLIRQPGDKFEQWQFDHAKEVKEKYFEGLEKVVDRLDGRQENLDLNEQLKEKARNEKLKSFLPLKNK